MRLALQLIALCVSDGVMHVDSSHYASPSGGEVLDIGMQLTANAAIRQLMVSFEAIGHLTFCVYKLRWRLHSFIITFLYPMK